ncbi:MAG: S8 family serine peptidase [Planctomycetes bacterium]|nr:S8 family serine peptidase [Planctomycetota bacterium]
MMSILSSIRGNTLFVFFLLAGLAGAQGGAVEAELQPGDAFAGRIAFPGDEDLVSFPCLAGSRVTLRAGSLSNGKLHPRIEFLRDGVPVAVNAKQTHIFRVREHLPERVEEKLHLHAGEEKSLDFPARPGAVVEIVLTAAGKCGSLELPELLLPDGSCASLDGVVQALREGRKLRIGPLLLEQTGAHRLVVRAGLEQAQTIRVRIDLEHAEAAGGTHQEAAGHAAVSGSVSLSDGYWLGAGGGGDFSAEEVLMRVAPGADADALAARLGCRVAARGGQGWVKLERTDKAFLGPAASFASQSRVSDLVAAAAGLDGITHVQPNHLRAAFAVPDDPLYWEQWDMTRAGFENAWSVEQGDPARTVAVLDTGIRFEHPDLAGRLASGYDFVGDSWNAGDGNGIDANPTAPFLSVGTHGTHVAGTVAAAAGNGIGVAGGAMLGRVMPIRVLGVLGGTDFDIAQGVLYAAGLPNASGSVPSTRAEVINMSLGGPTYSEILHQAVRDAVAAGVVVVASAGNSASTAPMYPAAMPEVIAVSATDALDELTYYSSYGTHIDLAAPGGDKTQDTNGDGEPDGITSTIVDPIVGATYAQKTGTSMAAPHVAAAAFLVRSVAPALTPLEVEAFLAAGAQDLGKAGPDKEYGFGRLDAGRAVSMAAGQDVGPTAPFCLPQGLSFPEDADVLQVAVINGGGDGAIAVTSVSSSAFWLAPLQCSGQTPCTLDVQVCRLGLAPGTYGAMLQIETSAGPLSLPVTMTVAQSGGPIGVQVVYVLAVDVISGLPVAVHAVTQETADLYLLDPLPEGTYRVFAATDLDHDGIVGEPHDYAGQALDPESGAPKLMLADGFSLANASIMLESGGSGTLPGGGSIPLPGGT